MSPPPQPAYNFTDFQEACELREPKKVFVWPDAVADADTFFSLRPERVILDFIANGGLQDLEFINQKPLESRRNVSNPEIVDAYEFRTGYKRGYLAFYRTKTGNWFIKSFHLKQPMNSLGDALKIAGLIP